MKIPQAYGICSVNIPNMFSILLEATHLLFIHKTSIENTSGIWHNFLIVNTGEAQPLNTLILYENF